MWVDEKNGKYCCRASYIDAMTGKKKTVSITIDKNTKVALKQAELTLQKKIEEKQYIIEKADITLSDLIDAYMQAKEHELKQSTLTRNKFACDSFKQTFGGDILLSKLTANYVRTKLLETKRGAGTLNEKLTRFKALMRWGYKNDYIEDVSWLDKIDLFKDKENVENDVKKLFLEKEELSTLLKGMNHKKWRDVTLFLALSGLRIGEFVALTKNDVDFNTRMIKVSKTYDVVNEIVTSPKTSSSIREVYMQDELLQIALVISADGKRDQLKRGYKTDLFASNVKGGYIKYYAFGKYLRENSLAILGSIVTPHKLRHTHTCLLAEQGIPLESISRRLGHEDSRITKEVYLHITEKMKERDNELFAKVKIF